MGLIWQELKAIMADAWDVIATWGGILLKGMKSLLRDAAANYQRVMVVGVGIPVSLFLLGLPFLALLEALGSYLKSIFFEPSTPRIFGGSFIEYLLMFCLGLVVVTLTVELDDRLMKRLEGKSKSDATPPESEE